MKILIICSKKFYSKIEEIKNTLEKRNIEVFLPNCYDDPTTEQRMWELGKEEHQKFKARMYKQSEEIISKMDAVLVLNFDKEKDGEVYKNYIGGATFLEIYDAFRFNKKIYLYNDIPSGILLDEIEGFAPIIINGNLDLIDDLSKEGKNSTLQKYQEQSSNASTEKQCELKELSFCKYSEPVAVKEAHPGFDEPSDSYKRYVEYSKDCSAGGRVRAAEHRTIGPSTSNK